MFGTAEDGITRISNASLWDFASHSYVAEAHGSFRIIAPQKLGDLSVFVQSELPALLDNPKISTIEGIPRTDLLNLKNTHGIETVKQFITSTSLNHVIYGGLSAAHIDDYLDILTPGKFDALAADKSKIAALENYLTNHPDQRAYLNQAQEFINDIAKADSGFAVVFKKALGPVSIGLGLVLASWEAGAAELAGDHEGAKDRMIKWAVDAAGSEITQLAAGTLAAVGIAALIPAESISVPVAGAIVAGVALAGGFFGGDGATGLYELLKDKNKNDQIDILDKLHDLLFGNSGAADLPPDLDGGDLTFLPAFDHSQIVEHAKADIAWRYALQQLNPFIIPDIDHAQHNADGSLDLHDPATGQGVVTEQWINDRARFVVLAAKASQTFVPNLFLSWSYYEDIASGKKIGVPILTDKYIFGGGGADVVEGGLRGDHLYGGGGNDTLAGNGGDDYLEGGRGDDTFGGAQSDVLLGGGRRVRRGMWRGNPLIRSQSILRQFPVSASR